MLYCLALRTIQRNAQRVSLDGRQGERHVCPPIFDVDDIPAHLNVRKKRQGGLYLVVGNPTSAVKVHNSWSGSNGLLVLPDIQLQGSVVGISVDDIGGNSVLSLCYFSPGGDVYVCADCRTLWRETTATTSARIDFHTGLPPRKNRCLMLQKVRFTRQSLRSEGIALLLVEELRSPGNSGHTWGTLYREDLTTRHCCPW